jgi:hypothetical protein
MSITKLSHHTHTFMDRQVCTLMRKHSPWYGKRYKRLTHRHATFLALDEIDDNCLDTLCRLFSLAGWKHRLNNKTIGLLMMIMMISMTLTDIFCSCHHSLTDYNCHVVKNEIMTTNCPDMPHLVFEMLTRCADENLLYMMELENRCPEHSGSSWTMWPFQAVISIYIARQSSIIATEIHLYL